MREGIETLMSGKIPARDRVLSVPQGLEGGFKCSETIKQQVISRFKQENNKRQELRRE